MRATQVLAAAAAVGILLWSCGEDTVAETSELDRFESDYLTSWHEFRPSLATIQGIRQYEGRIESFPSAGVQRRIDDLRRQLGRIVAQRRRPMPPDAAIRSRLLDYRVRAEMLDLELIARWRYDPEFYLQVAFDSILHLTTRNYAPESQRLRSLTLNLYELASIDSSMRYNLQAVPAEQARRGLLVARRLQELVGDLEDWGTAAAGVDVTLREDFLVALSSATENLDATVAWLEQEVVPASSGELRLGPERFVMKLLFDETLEIPLAELTNLGGQKLAEDTGKFLEQAKLIDASSPPAEVFRAVASERPDGQLAAEIAQLLREARQHVEQHRIVPLPETAEVVPLASPSYLTEPLSPFWMSLPGSELTIAAQLGTELAQLSPGMTQGLYYYSSPAGNAEAWTGSWSPAELTLSVIEDGIPGRYLMAVYAPQAPDQLRRILSSRATVEGWAAYAREVMLEEGFGYGSPKLRLCHLQREMVADCRLLASVALHTSDTTIDEVTALFVTKAFLAPDQARFEALRALRDPTFFAGLLGKMEILRLRDDYRSARAGTYSLSKFHSDYLSQGPVPVAIARQMLGLAK